MNYPKLFAITSPSGGGKTSIIKVVLERHPEIKFSISATTRPMRSGEVNGREYFFLSQEEFQTLIEHDELVEYEQLYTDYYGTLQREVNRALQAGSCMIFDVDVKGARSIQQKYPNEAVLIFIMPPSLEILEQRLRSRKTENEEKIQRRLSRAKMELEIGKTFPHIIVNDDLSRAINETENIIQSYLS
ncbi:MAG: guanylate kinase [Bacteroidetes bacterium]|nr:guanylate kinase [Bacteroidota bacterium]